MPIHPCLRRENFARLPVSLRRMANAAMDGSPLGDKGQGLAQLCRFTTEEHQHLILPALYANLDPAGIPSADVVDTMLVTHDPIAFSSILRALMALDQLPVISLTPHSTFPDLWGRVWPWIAFFDSYHESLRCIPPERELYSMFLGLFVHFQSGGGPGVIATTRGVRAIAARAWMVVQDTPDGQGLTTLCHFLRHESGLHNPEALDEIADGAGGMENLASMTLNLLTRAMGQDQTPLTSKMFYYASIAVKFMYEVHMYGGSNGPFGKALLSQGLARILTSALGRIDDVQTAYPTGPASLQLGLSVLHRWLPVIPGFTYVAQAVEAGLLRIIVSCTITNSELCHDHLDFFVDFLPAYTVYHSVLVHMKKALLHANELAVMPAFTSSKYYPKWQVFTTLARSRLRFLEYFESPSYHALKACDNMECDEVRLKDDFQRCASCQDLYYCSKQCQISDWKAGHRHVCKKFQALRQFVWERLTTRDRSFMRALLHDDYLELRKDVLIHQTCFLIAHPHVKFYTTFDYTAGAVTVNIKGVPTDGRGTDYHEPEWVARWEDQVQRASRSAGRMEVHLMLIRVGAGQHPLIMPLRANSMAVYDGVTDLAERVAREMELDLNGDTTTLLDGVDDLLQISVAPIH
ncbi:hypothetical protein FB451DRAFT_1370793 [Mycena latifolia]|nr:hypothetical protein FB451DRAFT_1370793 [Mycena latifolia]